MARLYLAEGLVGLAAVSGFGAGRQPQAAVPVGGALQSRWLSCCLTGTRGQCSKAPGCPVPAKQPLFSSCLPRDHDDPGDKVLPFHRPIFTRRGAGPGAEESKTRTSCGLRNGVSQPHANNEKTLSERSVDRGERSSGLCSKKALEPQTPGGG